MSYREAGEWKGITKFACDDCSFEALRERLIVEHVDQAHPRTRAPKVAIYGPDDKLVESVPVTDSPAETHEPIPLEAGIPVEEAVAKVITETEESEAPRSFLDSLRDRKF